MTKKPAANRRIVLAERPQGVATLTSFRLESVAVPEPSPGEALLKTLWLSLDPYMRGRMSDAPSYAPPVGLGEVMTAQTVARVESSSGGRFRRGDLVLAPGGWQEYSACLETSLTPLPKIEHPSWALGVLGMTGYTAYMGLLEIGKPKPGETVVVAAATGAVGSIVGQIAKLKGCRAIGIAGGAEKCHLAVNELGFDACIDHRSPTFKESLAAACPRGIDVYFENVGGKVFRAVVPLLNAHARIPLCGLIAHYSGGGAPEGHPVEPDWVPSLMRTLLVKRITLRGFIIFDDFADGFREFSTAMQGWLHEGRIKYREHVIEGLENAPRGLIGLLRGENFGKTLVRLQ